MNECENGAVPPGVLAAAGSRRIIRAYEWFGVVVSPDEVRWLDEAGRLMGTARYQGAAQGYETVREVQQ
jgi:hypothetical protein